MIQKSKALLCIAQKKPITGAKPLWNQRLWRLKKEEHFSKLSQSKKKEAKQENICYYLSQRFKVKICPSYELAKELTGGRCYKSTILDLIIKYIFWKWSLEKNS